jgi:transcriptional regulator of arginine metabolism
MHIDREQLGRRAAIANLLRDGEVRGQADLVRLLRKAGYDVTQSSVSRDLRDLGVLKARGRYLLPSADLARTQQDFGALAQFVRELLPAGPSLTVVKTTVGAAQSVAVAIDTARWPEVVGTLSGDDTIFIATRTQRHQNQLLERLHENFRI